MNPFIKGVLLIIFISFAEKGSSYVHTRTSTGDIIKWSDKNISLAINSSNTSGISNSIVETLITDSINEWNGKSDFRVLRGPNFSGGARSLSNEIYFSNSSSIFTGSGIAAVTQVIFEEASGRVIETDIIINDNMVFSSNKESSNYLGNVVTHEIGHLVGLGHSEVKGTSMFYKLFVGQNSVEGDDLAGIYSLYPNNLVPGKIKGKIIGSSSSIGIFGSHIQAISQKTGKVSGAALSFEDGSFSIEGLPSDDQYFLYIKPTELPESLPPYYKFIRNDFCNSRFSYRGSFFQSCFSSEEGFPQGITLSGSVNEIDVGKVSIKCSLDTPQNYFLRKGGLVNQVDIIDFSGNIGSTSVGYFANSTIEKSTTNLNSSLDNSLNQDNYRVNLSDFNILGANYYLEVKLIHQELYSPIQLLMDIDIPNETNVSLDTGNNDQNLVKDKDHNPNLDLMYRIPLGVGKSSDNNFLINISPRKINFQNFLSFDQENFFPDASNFEDELNFYLISFNLSQKVGNTFSVVSRKNYGVLTDNASCADAPRTYKVPSNIIRSSSIIGTKRKKEEGDSPVSCGTIDSGSHGGGGPFSLMIGLFLSAILIPFFKKSDSLKKV